MARVVIEEEARLNKEASPTRQQVWESGKWGEGNASKEESMKMGQRIVLEYDHIRLRRKLESVLGELNSIPVEQDHGDAYLERATEIVIEIENEAIARLNFWKEFTSSKEDDLKLKYIVVDGLEKLVKDIQAWFVNDEYTQTECCNNAFCFDKTKGGWTITFDGRNLFIKNKSGLIQLAYLLMDPGRKFNLKELSNNVVRPNSISSVDNYAKNELSGMAKDGFGGISIDATKCNARGTEINNKDISRVYYAISSQIEKIEHSNQDYEKKHEEIEDILDKFARYIGKTSVPLKAFKGEHFLRNISRENKKKLIRANNSSITSAEAVEKAMRRCIDALKIAIPGLGNYLSSNIKFETGSATYSNSDKRMWKIMF